MQQLEHRWAMSEDSMKADALTALDASVKKTLHFWNVWQHYFRRKKLCEMQL